MAQWEGQSTVSAEVTSLKTSDTNNTDIPESTKSKLPPLPLPSQLPRFHFCQYQVWALPSPNILSLHKMTCEKHTQQLVKKVCSVLVMLQFTFASSTTQLSSFLFYQLQSWPEDERFFSNYKQESLTIYTQYTI